MADPYLTSMDALNAQSQILADKAGFLDRTKWLRMDDITRSAMTAALAGMGGTPVTMGLMGLAAAADTAREQMYPSSPSQATLAGVSRRPKLPVPEGMTRLYRGEPPSGKPSGPIEGNWFSIYREVAEDFAAEAALAAGGKARGRLSYVDVPTDKLESYHPMNHPSIRPYEPGRPGGYTQPETYGREGAVILPPEIAKLKKRLR